MLLLSAMAMTEEGARRAAETGPLGVITWVILALVALLSVIVTALTVQLGRQNRTLKDASDANREERRDMANRYERLTREVITIAQGQTAAVYSLASRMEARPCLIGAHLANGATGQPASEAGREEGEEES